METPYRLRSKLAQFLPPLLVIACSGASVAEDGVEVAPRFPVVDYIAGEGFGPDRTSAEAAAKANVAGQVKSEIASVIEDTAGYANDQDYQKILVTVRQTAQFRHAELIELPPGGTRCNRNGCRALAVLPRTRAAAILVEEYRLASASYREAATRIVGETRDLQGFTTGFREAERLFPTLADSGLQLRVIRRQPVAEHEADRELFARVLVARGRLLASVRVTVLTGRITPPALREQLGNALVGALGELGLSAVTGTWCESGAVLEPTASLDCTAGHFGPVCQVVARAVLRDCTSGRELAPLDLGELARGAHPKTPEFAAEDAVRKLEVRALVPVLRKQLSAILPVK